MKTGVYGTSAKQNEFIFKKPVHEDAEVVEIVHKPRSLTTPGGRVIAIGPKAFLFLGVKEVVVQSGIELIDAQAFMGSKLEKIVFLEPSKLHKIDDSVFSFCNLRSIIFPTSLEKIGSRAFEECSNLTEVLWDIPGSRCKIIEEAAFCGTKIREIIIPRSIRRIGERAFAGCPALKRVEFEDDSKLVVIKEMAFSTSVEEIAAVGQDHIIDMMRDTGCVNAVAVDTRKFAAFCERHMTNHSERFTDLRPGDRRKMLLALWEREPITGKYDSIRPEVLAEIELNRKAKQLVAECYVETGEPCAVIKQKIKDKLRTDPDATIDEIIAYLKTRASSMR